MHIHHALNFHITPLDTSTGSAGAAATSSSASAQNSDSELTSENTFLKLLVAQIKNQDPLNPTDPTQFVGQLTQYSELEQLIQINSGVQKIGGSGSSVSTGLGTNTTQPVQTNSNPAGVI